MKVVEYASLIIMKMVEHAWGEYRGDSPMKVKIQNRGPEQEIPAVTCVRLIAQKHRY